MRDVVLFAIFCLLFVCWFLFAFFVCYSFFITVPALLDRSISLYLLRLLEVEQSAASQHQLNTWYINGFVYHNNAVMKRLNEQVYSGNIKLVDDCYTLTDRGRFILKVNDLFVSLFKTDARYSRPEGYNLRQTVRTARSSC